MKKPTRTRRAEPPKRTGLNQILCRQVTALIANYLSGELDADTRLALEAHLIDCDDCLAFLSTYKRTIQAVRFSLRYEELPPSLQSRVLQLVRKRLKP